MRGHCSGCGLKDWPEVSSWKTTVAITITVLSKHASEPDTVPPPALGELAPLHFVAIPSPPPVGLFQRILDQDRTIDLFFKFYVIISFHSCIVCTTCRVCVCVCVCACIWSIWVCVCVCVCVYIMPVVIGSICVRKSLRVCVCVRVSICQPG